MPTLKPNFFSLLFPCEKCSVSTCFLSFCQCQLPGVSWTKELIWMSTISFNMVRYYIIACDLHVILCVLLYAEKYRSTMATSQPRTRLPISQRILLLFLTLDQRHHPYHRPIMMICSYLKGMEKPLCSSSREMTGLDFWLRRVSTIWGEKHSHFWPCQLRSPNTSTLKVGERECIWRQNGGVHCIVPFSLVLAWNLTFFMSSILSRFSPDSAANMQQSIVKEGGTCN